MIEREENGRNVEGDNGNKGKLYEEARGSGEQV